MKSCGRILSTGTPGIRLAALRLGTNLVSVPNDRVKHGLSLSLSVSRLACLAVHRTPRDARALRVLRVEGVSGPHVQEVERGRCISKHLTRHARNLPLN